MIYTHFRGIIRVGTLLQRVSYLQSRQQHHRKPRETSCTATMCQVRNALVEIAKKTVQELTKPEPEPETETPFCECTHDTRTRRRIKSIPRIRVTNK